MKAGAKDFLEKNSTAAALMEAINRALIQCERQQARHDRLQAQRALVASLSPREAEVFRLVIRGHLNKQIAYALGISERTVKVHRHQVMEKLDVRSLAEVVSIAAYIGLIDQDTAAPSP
jgi:FixJ family two-component response regulator